MQPTKVFSMSVAAAISAAMVLMFMTTALAAEKEKVIYSFKGGNDEGFPYSSLIFDQAGNLYGTTCGGGSENYYGTAYKLTPSKAGPWKIAVLHIFTGATDGSCPRSGLIMDKAGNLYGTTTAGGNLNFCNGLGCGTVFKLSPKIQGWKETVLYAFRDANDGGHPYAGLIFDAAGHLYGTTLRGGPADAGVAFELIPTSKGMWKEKVIHAFANGADGGYLNGGLIFDGAGSLYGAASEGGNRFAGTVFKLTHNSSGWEETTLYSFTSGADGGTPLAGLVIDGQGNLYGTASSGGNGNGLVFELTPTSSGWTENVLYSFNGNDDGRYPHAAVIFDAAGNLYGTNFYGGTVDGTVFKLSPGSQGWSETILYSFTGGSDGGEPEAAVVFDKLGNLYSTASVGGARGWGCVFRVGSQSGSK
jgi:hypothetical protein